MRKRGFVTMMMVGLLGLAQSLAAETHPNLDANAIREQQQQIRADAQAKKGPYKDLSPQKREELFKHQSVVMDLTQSIKSTTDLEEPQQVALFNALESIEAIVNAAEDERLVCERIRPIGSNRTQTSCKTVAQRRAEREAAQKNMGNRNLECSEAVMGPGGCR